MRRKLTRPIALALCAALLLPSAWAAEEPAEAAADVTWEELEARVRAGSLNSQALSETISRINAIDYEEMQDQLRTQLNGLAEVQWATSQKTIDYTLPGGGSTQVDNPYYNSYTAGTIGEAYSSIREVFDSIKDGDMQEDNADNLRQIKNGIQQIVSGSQELYLTILGLERTREDGERGLATLDRSLTELRLRQSLGQVSQQQVEALEQTRNSTVSQLKTLDNAISTCKLQLQVLIGEEPTGKLTLAPLPQEDGFDWSQRNYDEDLAAAKEASWTLYTAKNTLDDAEKDWKDDRSAGWAYARKMAEHAWSAAQATYAAQVQSFETSFRSLYDSLADYEQVYESKCAATTYQKLLLSIAQLRYDRGMISRNSLLSVQDDLSAARSAQDSAWQDLFSARNSYRNAVEHGLL